MSRSCARRARVMGVALFALFCGGAVHGQPGGGPFVARSSTTGGTSFFVAPHVEAAHGRLRFGGQLQLGWGSANMREGGGFVELALSEDARISTSWLKASTIARERRGSDRTFALSLESRGAGLTAARRVADSRLDSFTQELRGTEVRAWTGLGRRFDLGLSFREAEVAERGEGVDVRRYIVANYEFIWTRRFEYTYIAERQDLELDLTAQFGDFALTGVAGRGFADGLAADRTWAYGRIAAPLPHGLQLLVEAGRNDGGASVARATREFVRIGFRVDLARRDDSAPVPSPGTTSNATAERRAASASLVGSGPTTRLLIVAPHATRVEVKGDFTGWEPVPMTRIAEGRWTAAVRAGVLRFNIRVDGADWTVPAGVPVIPDEFSGALVAVLVVR
jgi:hypothetical protein